MNAGSIYNSSDGCYMCSTTVPAGTWFHWSTDSWSVWVGWDGTASVADGRRSVAGKLKVDKDCSQHTHMHMHMRTPRSCANTHTRTHTVVWIRVEHWAYWRPQLVVAEKSVTSQQPTTTTTVTIYIVSITMYKQILISCNWHSNMDCQQNTVKILTI